METIEQPHRSRFPSPIFKLTFPSLSLSLPVGTTKIPTCKKSWKLPSPSLWCFVSFRFLSIFCLRGKQYRAWLVVFLTKFFLTRRLRLLLTDSDFAQYPPSDSGLTDLNGCDFSLGGLVQISEGVSRVWEIDCNLRKHAWMWVKDLRKKERNIWIQI